MVAMDTTGGRINLGDLHLHELLVLAREVIKEMEIRYETA